MSSLSFKAFQFLSRKGVLPVSTRMRFPTTGSLTASFEYEIIPKPFEINFAAVAASPPSIGAHQWVDPQIDFYSEIRWPECIAYDVQVRDDRNDNLEASLTGIMLSINDVIFACHRASPEFSDQFSVRQGYRRGYMAKQKFDAFGHRRPNSSEYYHTAKVGEFLGPGFVTLMNGSKDTFELVWSQIIPFPNQSSIAADLPKLKSIVSEIRLHYNTYNELRDAKRYLESNGAGDIKGAIRSAASGVDALLRFYCELHSMKMPKGSDSFDMKIETLLSQAGMPSFKGSAPSDSLLLRDLYRARNSMHEGDCYLKDAVGKKKPVQQQQAKDMVAAAERFAVWADALA